MSSDIDILLDRYEALLHLQGMSTIASSALRTQQQDGGGSSEAEEHATATTAASSSAPSRRVKGKSVVGISSSSTTMDAASRGSRIVQSLRQRMQAAEINRMTLEDSPYSLE